MGLPRLYGVMDERVLPNDRLVAAVEVMLQAGLRLVQARFKEAGIEERLSLGRELRLRTREHGALLIANDSPELAAEVGADGVHLGAGDATPDEARRLLGPEALIGVSGYADPDRVRGLDPAEIAYVGLSTPWASTTKPGKPNPPRTAFESLVAAAPVPVFAIGGVRPEHVPALRAAGCHGVAAVAGLFGAPDPAAAVRSYLARL